MKNLFEINNNNNNKCDGKHCSSVLSGKLEKESNRDRRCMKKREKNAPSEVEMCKIIHGKCQYSTQCVHTPNLFFATLGDGQSVYRVLWIGCLPLNYNCKCSKTRFHTC